MSAVCVLSCFSHVPTLCDPMAAKTQVTLWNLPVPLSMGFSRQYYWSGLPCPPPGDLPHPGIEPASLMSPELAGGFFATNATWEAHAFLGSGPSYLTLGSGTHIVFISFGLCNPLHSSPLEFMTLFFISIRTSAFSAGIPLHSPIVSDQFLQIGSFAFFPSCIVFLTHHPSFDEFLAWCLLLWSWSQVIMI